MGFITERKPGDTHGLENFCLNTAKKRNETTVGKFSTTEVYSIGVSTNMSEAVEAEYILSADRFG